MKKEIILGVWLIAFALIGVTLFGGGLLVLPDGYSEPVLPQPATEYLGPATGAGKARQLTASWYGAECAGKPMANGEPFDPERYTCASWDYPLGAWLRVSVGDKGVYCLVTDRGPAKRLLSTRQIDLSESAFRQLGKLWDGLMKVSVTEIVE